MPALAFAYDRSTSSTGRWTDLDGRMHAPGSTITRCEVSDYLGSELPNASALGLDQSAIYPMLRPGPELEAACAAFDGLPLLSKHVAITAAAHRPDLVVGVVLGPVWQDPEIRAELIVWSQEAIARIEAADAEGVGCGVSAGYRFTPIMRAGTHRGQRYAGIMTGIGPNHVSLVDRPRIHGAVVADGAPAPRLRFKMPEIGYPQPRY
jgi:hypothetical protein